MFQARVSYHDTVCLLSDWNTSSSLDDARDYIQSPNRVLPRNRTHSRFVIDKPIYDWNTEARASSKCDFFFDSDLSCAPNVLVCRDIGTELVRLLKNQFYGLNRGKSQVCTLILTLILILILILTLTLILILILTLILILILIPILILILTLIPILILILILSHSHSHSHSYSHLFSTSLSRKFVVFVLLVNW